MISVYINGLGALIVCMTILLCVNARNFITALFLIESTTLLLFPLATLLGLKTGSCFFIFLLIPIIIFGAIELIVTTTVFKFK